MYIAMLILLFIAVFAFLFWLVIKNSLTKKPAQPETTYICPVCNETECHCHKADEKR